LSSAGATAEPLWRPVRLPVRIHEL
jgi:hypothetical protein